MDTKLKKQAAIVTGAGGSIGMAVCRALARSGVDVIAVDLRPASAEAVVQAVRAEGRNA